jgi:hypothetical protein
LLDLFVMISTVSRLTRKFSRLRVSNRCNNFTACSMTNQPSIKTKISNSAKTIC